MASSKARQEEQKLDRSGPLGKLKVYLNALGPGLITGASDDDPSGIGTYSQTGAQFGYAQLWTALFAFPLMTAIQEICARIALQTGGGLADAIRKHYPKPVLYFCVTLLFIANTINLGADLGAMAASAQMLLGIPYLAWLILITLLSAALEIFVDYKFFWQASQEIEEEIDEGKTTAKSRKGISKVELKWMRTDVVAGMLLSNVVMWFIIATTASTLFQHGIKNIDSAPKAAEALRPIAGEFAYLLFAVGIIGTGLLAVPILAGSAAYAIAEAFKLRKGLYMKLRQAPGFYGVIVFSTLFGFALDLIGINPMQALYYTAVLNGIVAPPLLVMIMLIGNNRSIMKKKVNGRMSNTLGWITTIAMSIAAAALLLTLGAGQ
jgi:Mn2+/Fe2+ NRAMP family transporter